MSDSGYNAFIQGLGLVGSAFRDVNQAKARKEEVSAQRALETERITEEKRAHGAEETYRTSQAAAESTWRTSNLNLQKQMRNASIFSDVVQRNVPFTIDQNTGTKQLDFSKVNKTLFRIDALNNGLNKEEIDQYLNGIEQMQAQQRAVAVAAAAGKVPLPTGTTSSVGESAARSTMGLGMGAAEALSFPFTLPGMLQNWIAPGSVAEESSKRLPTSFGDIQSRIGAMSDLTGQGNIGQALVGGPEYQKAYEGRQKQYSEAEKETPFPSRAAGAMLTIAGGLRNLIKEGPEIIGKEGVKKGEAFLKSILGKTKESGRVLTKADVIVPKSIPAISELNRPNLSSIGEGQMSPISPVYSNVQPGQYPVGSIPRQIIEKTIPRTSPMPQTPGLLPPGPQSGGLLGPGVTQLQSHYLSPEEQAIQQLFQKITRGY